MRKNFMSENREKPIYDIKKRLDSMKAARQFQARAIIKYDQGEISGAKLETISKAMNTLLRALEKSDIEQRIDKLEEIIKEHKYQGRRIG